MILRKLILENFRQFRGRQEVVFADSSDRNVTVIHAENGFGKTTLLNALLWAFYGHRGLTEDVEGKKSIIHHGVAVNAEAEGGDAEAVATLLFDHQGRRYVLQRSQTLAQQQAGARATSLELEFLEAGNTYRRRNAGAQEEVEKILPEATGKLLFFDGEGIDQLAMEGNSRKIAEAIERMLGLEILQMAIDDLRHQSVRGRLMRDLREKTSDEKGVLIDELAKIEERLTETEQKLALSQQNRDSVTNLIEAIEGDLLANKKVRDLQERRRNLHERTEINKTRLKEVLSKMGQIWTTDGYTLFSGNLVRKGQKIVSDLRDANQIPAPVIDCYLDGLLNSGVCICDRTLPKGSQEYASVQRKLSTAPNKGFNNAVGQLENALGIVETARTRAIETLRELNLERLRLVDSIDHDASEIANIHAEIGVRDDSSAKELEEKRSIKESEKEEIVKTIGRLSEKRDSLLREKEAKEAKIRVIEEKEDAAQLAQRRIDVLEKTIALAENILELEKAALRPLLGDEIARHFDSVIDRDYSASLTPKFELRITQQIQASDGRFTTIDVAKSKGQRQVTALCFIGALVAVARRRAEAPSILKDISGADYPVVMDSPFGNLSHAFRRQIATLIPRLAPQVVILASASQYDGAVADVLKKSGKVGKRYYLAYHGPRLDEDSSPTLRLEESEFVQYHENPEEFTQVKEIEA